jgi:uncharacterized protein (TIGR02265 family)
MAMAMAIKAVEVGPRAAGRIKGGVLLSRMRYLRDRGGEVLVDRVLGRLSAADQEVLRGMLLPVPWYDLDLNLRLDAAIQAVVYPGQPERAFLEMGRSSAEASLVKGPHAMFIKAGDPHFMLSQARVIYRHYYAVGFREYERLGDTHAVLRTHEAATATVTDCLTIIGWHTRALELSGATAVQITHPQCRGKGDALCRYDLRWS